MKSLLCEIRIGNLRIRFGTEEKRPAEHKAARGGTDYAEDRGEETTWAAGNAVKSGGWPN